VIARRPPPRQCPSTSCARGPPPAPPSAGAPAHYGRHVRGRRPPRPPRTEPSQARLSQTDGLARQYVRLGTARPAVRLQTARTNVGEPPIICGRAGGCRGTASTAAPPGSSSSSRSIPGVSGSSADLVNRHTVVFGVPLPLAVRISRLLPDLDVPAVVHQCIEYLNEHGAVQ